MTTAMEENARVKPGRMSASKCSGHVLPQPEVGKMPRVTPKTMSSTKPTQNEGAARPMRAKMRVRMSGSLSFFTPAM